MRSLENVNGFYILRFFEDADYTTYYNRYDIIHVYVSSDVTFTRGAKTIKTEYSNGPINYSAVNLPLKTGWNLVQTDYNGTETSGTHTVKIATKNIPWTLND
jgi:hypothetical protein